MTVELWNEKTRNAIDDFDTESEALVFVREAIALRGEKAVATWALDIDDGAHMIRGQELVRRALAILA